MVNCNPETVSTDYDTSDRLYFEPLTLEHVLEILRVEQSGGHAARRHRPVRRPDAAETRQAGLEAAGIPILGTTPDAIDLAEDRERFQKLLQDLEADSQPKSTASPSLRRDEAFADRQTRSASRW